MRASAAIEIVPEIEMPGHALAADPRLSGARHRHRSRRPASNPTGASSPISTMSRRGPSPSSRMCSTRCWRCSPAPTSMSAATRRSRTSGAPRPASRRGCANSASPTRRRCRAGSSAGSAASWRRAGRRLIGWDEILEGGLPAGRDGDVVAGHGRRDPGGAGRARRGARAGADPLFRQPPGRDSRPSRRDAAISSTLARRLCLRSGAGDADRRRSRRTFWGCRGICGPSMSAPRSAPPTWPSRARRRWPSSAGRRPARAILPASSTGSFRSLRRLGALGLDAASERVPARGGGAVRCPRRAGSRSRLSNQAGSEIRYTLDGSAPTQARRSMPRRSISPLPARLRARGFHRGEALPGELDRVYDAAGVQAAGRQSSSSCAARTSRCAGGRRAGRRSARRLPHRHHEPLLDLRGGAAGRRHGDRDRCRPAPLQLPDRPRHRADPLPAAGHAEPARWRCARAAARASGSRCCRWRPLPPIRP